MKPAAETGHVPCTAPRDHRAGGGRVWRGQTTSPVSAVLELEMGRTVAAEVNRVAGQKVARPFVASCKWRRAAWNSIGSKW